MDDHGEGAHGFIVVCVVGQGEVKAPADDVATTAGSGAELSACAVRYDMAKVFGVLDEGGRVELVDVGVRGG